MSRTKIRQGTQVHASDIYDDTLPSGSTLEISDDKVSS